MKYRSRFKRDLCLCSALSAMIISGAAPMASAAEEGALELSEIIVTARKQQETIQDVPISITAFNADMIESYNFRNVVDIAYSIPNMNISRLTTLSTEISIRGVGSADSAPGFETGIAVILDDVYIGRAAGFSTSLLDIEQIEVLRGPQGTLQGRNVTGGSINISTSRPSNELTGKARVSYGNYDQFVATGVISGPIIKDKLAAKIGIGRYYRDGFARNVTLDKPLDSEDAWSFRGQLAFTPSEDLEILLSADYDDYTNHDTHGDFGAPGIPSLDEDNLDRLAYSDIWNRGDRQVGGVAMNIYYTFPNDMTLASITSYREYEANAIQDGDPDANLGVAGIGTFFATAQNNQDQHQFSQEVRLASSQDQQLTWLAGLYYYEDSLSNYQNFLAGFNVDGSRIAGANTIDDSTVTTNSYAAFGSATSRFSEIFSVTAGLRYTIDKRDISVTESLGIDGTDPMIGDYVNMPTAANPAPKAYDATIVLGTTVNDITDKALTGDLTLTMDWTDDVSTFVKYARGYKGGGFNSSFNNGFSGEAVKPEFINSGEVGLRSELLDRRLRFNVTGYYLKVKDAQSLIYDPVNFRYVPANEPGVRSWGFELDSTFLVAENLTWSFSTGYINSKYKGGDNDGLRPALTSPWSVHNSLSYSHPVSGSMELFVFGEASWRDGYDLTPGGQGITRQDAYWWVSGRIGVQSSDGIWTLGLYGRNLTNETVASSATDVPGLFSIAFLQQPRTYGVELSLNF